LRVLAAPSAKAGAIELTVTAAASALAVKNFAVIPYSCVVRRRVFS
jgi:hypothetical protein